MDKLQKIPRQHNGDEALVVNDQHYVNRGELYLAVCMLCGLCAQRDIAASFYHAISAEKREWPWQASTVSCLVADPVAMQAVSVTTFIPLTLMANATAPASSVVL